MKTKKPDQEHIPDDNLTVVMIGSDRTGIDALVELFSAIDPNAGMAYVYISEEADLSGLMVRLQEVTTIPFKKLSPGVTLVPDTINIIPANVEMNIAGKTLQAYRENISRVNYKPIDKYFVRFAHGYGGTLIGVLLSGAGNDGCSGSKAIKIAGGITFAQDDSAAETSMPLTATKEGVIDLVLSPAEIAKELNNMSPHQAASQEKSFELNGIGNDDEHLQGIIQLIKKSTSIDFSQYKVSTIKRRIVRRMLLHKITDLKSFYDYLKRHAGAVSQLHHDLLINVTCFFRDGDAMEYLRKAILPQLLKAKAPDDTLRIWVPACSTGEEAYSLAVLLLEIQEETGNKNQIQIFGTDLSEVAIAKARLGIYSAADLADLSEIRLSKYFVRTDGDYYKVNKNVRELCVFAQHNVFKDPPFSRLDMISCCNFFIYLDNALQQKCAALFHYALNPNGYLILGKSETITKGGQQLFSQVEKKFKVYRKKSDVAPKVMSDITYRLPSLGAKETVERKYQPAEMHPEPAVTEKMVDDILYARYVPAAVVINQEMEILQFRGTTGLYLEHPQGKATFNLMKMARPSLTLDLRNCIHKAQVTQKEARKADIELRVKNQQHAVSITVVPIESNNDDKLLLVIFEEQQPGEQLDFSKDETVHKLQEELIAVRNDMQAIIDDHEANKEELQSANEEIISSNEELQSINEELETSKEEVESANEELMAINTELQMTNDQLLESQEYADAIFSTIREGVVVLNTDFRVKLANTAFYKAFRMQPKETEGRLLYDIGSGQWNNPKIKELINKILLHDEQFDGYELQHYLPGIGDRTLLVNGRKILKGNKQELMLLAFEDITDRKVAAAMQAEREEWFRNTANNAPVMIWTADANGKRDFFNVTWLTYTGHALEDQLGDGWQKEIYPEDRERFLQDYKSGFESRTPFVIEYRLRRHDGLYRWVKAVGKPTFSHDEQFTGFVGICAEIHDTKLIQAELEQLVSERTFDLEQTNRQLKKSNAELEQFAYVASHDLQEPLRKILLFVDRLTSGQPTPDAAKDYIDKIEDSALRMSQLISDVLDFSKMTRAAQAFMPTDLSTILATELEIFELSIKEKQAIVMSSELPVIDAIPVQIQQLFHNIIGNALKFSKANVPLVLKIDCRRMERGEVAAIEGLDETMNFYEIVFKDNGIGFNNEYAQQIFVLFKRLNARHEYPGTGIGLALCQKIVENHRGKIFADSIEGVLTQFHIILPERQPTTVRE